MPTLSMNLKELTVEHCDGLVNLFKSATTKSLAQLRTLLIKNCKMMEEVLSSNGEVYGDGEIIFNALYKLELYNLPSLTTQAFALKVTSSLSRP